MKEELSANLDKDHRDKVLIALIDPRLLTCLSLSHLLGKGSSANRRSEDFVVLPFSSPAELLTNHSESCTKLKLLLLNIGASPIDDERVLENIRVLRQKLSHIPLIILADSDSPCHIVEAFHQGVRGYIPMTLNPVVMVQALRLIAAGGTFIPPNIFLQDTGKKLIEKLPAISQTIIKACLTPRQMEVLQLLQQGKSNKIIAYELEMQESTVKVHIRGIMRKLKAANRTQAALLAYQAFQPAQSDLSPTLAI
jgi:DNA-binding NarL/FixJ family response regulator